MKKTSANEPLLDSMYNRIEQPILLADDNERIIFINNSGKQIFSIEEAGESYLNEILDPPIARKLKSSNYFSGKKTTAMNGLKGIANQSITEKGK